ncbi:MAG: NeuD/PglB/VioB family sugar acetyltransferase [Bacteroidales bacterium]|jgi:sugar O-acyltransferase (sialic acid O-acetyltransferase NeuD family)
MKRLAIIGSGELGIQILNLTEYSTEKFKVVGYYDDTKPIGQVVVDNLKVLGNLDNVLDDFNNNLFDELVIAVGYIHLNHRKSIFDKFSEIIPFASIIHKTCLIDETATIDSGSVLYAGCIIDKNVHIKNNVLLNLGVVVSHDTAIGNHSFIAPGVVISGFVEIDELNFIGSGTVIVDNVKVCAQNVIGAGSVVPFNLKKSGLYVGNRLRKIK